MKITHEWVDREDLLSAFGRDPSDSTLQWFGVTRGQFRAWARKPHTRQPIALSRLIRYRQRFHLAELLGPDWDGFAVHGNALEFPGLNRALPVGELRALWFNVQQAQFHKHRADRLTREIERDRQEREALELSAAFYRRQLRLESGLGLMLSRVA